MSVDGRVTAVQGGEKRRRIGKRRVEGKAVKGRGGERGVEGGGRGGEEGRREGGGEGEGRGGSRCKSHNGPIMLNVSTPTSTSALVAASKTECRSHPEVSVCLTPY